jgi:hypothetical protein
VERRRDRDVDAVPVPLHGVRPDALPPTGQANLHFPNRYRASVFVPALVILIGMALRMGMLGLDMRFHPDEALFAAQARLISHQGDLLLRNTDLDKPPLTFYTTALSFRTFGPTEFAARLPNVLFSGLSLAVLYALAWALYRDRAVAAVGTLLWALSPYDLAFAATVFTDVQATFWVLVASLCAVRDRWAAAGIAAGLMFASKPNAMLFVPLILALGIAHNVQPGWRVRDVARRVWRLVWPMLLGIALVMAWDAARAPRNFWDLNVARNDPGRLIRSDEVWPRLERWIHWLGFITGSRVLCLILLAGGALRLAWGVLRDHSRAAVADWQIAGFGLAFLGWYWLIAFNTYDRYLHTLVPFLLLGAGRVAVGAWRGAVFWLCSHRTTPTDNPLSHKEGGESGDVSPFAPGRGKTQKYRGGLYAPTTTVLLALLIPIIAAMTPAIVTTLRGEAAIGGDQGTHTGIDALADYLNTELRGKVVYDHWLGWELSYYLGESPPVILAYMPLPEALADDMAAQSSPRYFVAPSPNAAAPWIAALRQANVEIGGAYHDCEHGFVVYWLQSGRHLSLLERK